MESNGNHLSTHVWIVGGDGEVGVVVAHRVVAIEVESNVGALTASGNLTATGGYREPACISNLKYSDDVGILL